MVSSILTAADMNSATASRRVERGELVRLTRGIYSTDVDTPPERIVRREWHTIVGHLYSDAVITDRSAITGGPVDGVLYLARAGRARDTELPGLTVRARPGYGPLDGDVRMPSGIYQASKGRAFIENTAPSRARAGNTRRTLTEEELGDWIDRLVTSHGEEQVQRFRMEAEALAPTLDADESRVALMSRLVGTALGTQQADTASQALRARRSGLPYDHDRMRLLGNLITELRESEPQTNAVRNPTDDRYRHLPFFEAYFSNFIEGTEFAMDEAVAIVYDGKQIPGRSGDSHDLLGTYRVVNDLAEMQTLPRDADEFVQLLKARHAAILAGRPDKNPGQFKLVPNRAGLSDFVLPGHVDGTLRAGWERLRELDTPFEKAVFMMFLVAEVHPFDDGNGRVARVMMNAELVAKGESRIIIPTVFRDDYVDGLRMLTRQDRADVLIKALRYAHNYTAQIPWYDTNSAQRALTATNAFEEPNSSDRLILPSALRRRGGIDITVRASLGGPVNPDWAVSPLGTETSNGIGF